MADQQLRLLVKHGAQDVHLSSTSTSTVLNIKQQIEQATGVFVRQQKLIYKGKVLDDADHLHKCKLVNGARIMLLTSKGLPVKVHWQTGRVPHTKLLFRVFCPPVFCQPHCTVANHTAHAVLWRLLTMAYCRDRQLARLPSSSELRLYQLLCRVMAAKQQGAACWQRRWLVWQLRGPPHPRELLPNQQLHL